MDIPKKMKAAVLFGYNNLRVVEKEVPKVGPGEVLIKVKACAICGTDPHIISQGWPSNPPFGEYIPGHEFAGEIVKVGETVDEFKIGDRVAVEPHKGCGRCVNCIRGLYTICLNYGNMAKGHRHYGFTTNGGYAEYAVNHINTLHRIPEKLSFENATLITTAGTVMYGIERIGGIRPGETVVVTGPGPIGLMGVQIVKALGAGRVILTGTRESRLKVGREVGADETINIRQDDPVKKINELTHELGADVVVECSGNPRASAQAIDVIKKGGRIALVGIYQEPVTLNLNKVVQWNLSLAGGKAEGMWNLERAVPLMADGRIKAEPLITHIFPLEKINEAMETFVKRIGGAIKVVITP